MADDSQRPSMDGIRTNRGTAVVPVPTPAKLKPVPESHKSMGKQAQALVKAPVINTKQVAAPAASIDQVNQPMKPRRRLRGFFKWLLVLIVIAVILGGLYYGYLAYYAV